MRKLMGVVLAGAMAAALAAPAFADGAADYKAKCAMCHSADGTASSGMGKAMNIKSFKDPSVVKKSDADLIAITAGGKGKMPAYKGKLTDAQISGVVKYIRTLQK